uniref:Uncharacterized protein n=1 Tax=Cohnella candidum TaxID=2674991 RepID=A0A3G3K3H3_9BACL|nr:hypothetical protein EAV92_21995 [Cohnella candidum]
MQEGNVTGMIMTRPELVKIITKAKGIVQWNTVSEACLWFRMEVEEKAVTTFPIIRMACGKLETTQNLRQDIPMARQSMSANRKDRKTLNE